MNLRIIFHIHSGYRYTDMAPGGNLYFNYTDYLSQHNDVNSLSISEFFINLRFAPNEKFYQKTTVSP